MKFDNLILYYYLYKYIDRNRQLLWLKDRFLHEYGYYIFPANQSYKISHIYYNYKNHFLGLESLIFYKINSLYQINILFVFKKVLQIFFHGS